MNQPRKSLRSLLRPSTVSWQLALERTEGLQPSGEQLCRPRGFRGEWGEWREWPFITFRSFNHSPQYEKTTLGTACSLCSNGWRQL